MERRSDEKKNERISMALLFFFFVLAPFISFSNLWVCLNMMLSLEGKIR